MWVISGLVFWISFIFIMSFGAQEYQHRFFHSNVGHKKGALLSNNSQSHIFPQVSNQSHQFAQYSPFRSVPYTNQINLRARAGPLRMNEPGWQGYRLKSYVTDQYAQDYQQNAEMLERFKREAEEHRRRLRFGSLDNRYSIPRHEQSHISELYRELQDNKAKIQQLKHTMVYNPQVLRYNQDLLLRTRLESYERQRSHIMSRIEVNDSLTRRKLKDYKKKYSRLKNQLKQEMMYKQKLEIQNLKHQKQLAIRKQSEKLDHIQKMLGNISAGLHKNAEFIAQSMKLNSEISLKNQSSLGKSTITSKLISQRNTKNIIEEEKQVLSQEQELNEVQVKLPKLTPKIIYTKKKLENQYRQLQDLKKYIKTVDSRIKRLKTQ